MKSRFRKEPKPGDVLLIPLSEGDYAYILMYSFCWGWLLDFITTHPTKEPKYFKRECFKLPLGLYGRIEKCFKTVGHIELDEVEMMGPKLVHKMDPELQKFKGGTTPYEVLLPEGGGVFVTEEESKHFFPWVKVQPTRKDFDAFVQEKRSELRRIEVPPNERWAPKEDDLTETETDGGPVLVEVNFQCEPEDMGMEADEIAEHLGDDLFVNGLGQLMTMDSAGEDSEFEIILEVEAHRMKGAITQIRKTLKRLKAPADTRIIEVAYTGPIEHPLIAPPKGNPPPP